MTLGRAVATAMLTGAAATLAWLLFAGLPQWYRTPAVHGTPASSTGPDEAVRKIKARLFYVSEDGTQLIGIEREVPYAEGPVEQAKAILNEQIAPSPDGLLSAVPPGTMLRALFVTPTGEAYVDLSRELAEGHPGGSLNELLTIYTLVDALTLNLPSITSVQLLVDGKEVETLSGHVDVRRPLVKDLALVQ